MTRFNERDPNSSEKILKRMQIMSMVPVSLTSESQLDSLALDHSYDISRRCISAFAQTLEYASTPTLHRARPAPPARARNITPYEPPFPHHRTAFTEPCSYSPQYSAVALAPLLTRIQENPQHHRILRAGTTADITSEYLRDLRGFECSRVHNARELHEPIPEADHRIRSGFGRQTLRTDYQRRIERFEFPFTDHPPPPVQVGDFDAQMTRPDDEYVDHGRDYGERATQQAMKLKPRTHVVDFGSQFDRDHQPPKNERVTFLNGLVAEQDAMLRRLQRTRASSVTKQEVPHGTFSRQLGRERPVVVERVVESFPEADALKSLKKVWPRIPAVKIHPPSKNERQYEGPEFWQQHRGA
jgi:hypothetical protein